MDRAIKVALALFLAARAGAAEGERLRGSVAKGMEYLRRSGALESKSGVGPLCLSGLALIACGVPGDSPAVRACVERAIRELDLATSNQYSGTYRASVIAMLLRAAGERRFAANQTLLERLVSFQMRDGGWGDMSRTQFALLGLRALDRMGVEAPENMWKGARSYILASELKDGGWEYKRPTQPGAKGDSYGSMTAAAVGSLLIIEERAGKRSRVCGRPLVERAVTSGVRWLAMNFSATENPKRGGSHYHYYLYALERVGILSMRRFLGGHDWYEEGAKALMERQAPTGGWGSPVETAFALLFLGKAGSPIVVQKLKRPGEDWNLDPYDAHDLVLSVGDVLGFDGAARALDPASPLEEFLASPVIYLNGHDDFSLSRELKAKLGAFAAAGGTILGVACCGREEFARAFEREVSAALGGAGFSDLPSSHPVYSSQFELEPANFRGAVSGCRTGAILVPLGLCCSWGRCGGCPREHTLVEELAFKYGVNIIAYAAGTKRLRRRDAEKEVPAPVSGPAVVVGQIKHRGVWNPHPLAFGNLSRALAASLGFKGRLRAVAVEPGRDQLDRFPLLYMTGVRAFELGEPALDELRAHVERGGTLLADPACGSKDFDRAFRALVSRLFPGNALAVLPAGHELFSSPFDVTTVSYKRRVLIESPELSSPVIEAVVFDGWRLGVIYSPYNFGGELGGVHDASSRGYEEDSAFRLAMNIIVHVLTR